MKPRYFQSSEDTCIWKFSDEGNQCRYPKESEWKPAAFGIEDMGEYDYEITAEEGEP